MTVVIFFLAKLIYYVKAFLDVFTIPAALISLFFLENKEQRQLYLFLPVSGSIIR